ncbi:MAG TPA: hypothetical protein VF796_28265 [Humisphaera sp.]
MGTSVKDRVRGDRDRVSDRLRAAIAAAGAAGVSRYRIAKETGVEQSALSRFSRGLAGLDLSSVDRLAAFLGLELVDRPESRTAGKRKVSR